MNFLSKKKFPLVASAPMADISDSIFCALNKKMGAGLVFHEMVSSEAVVRQNEKTLKLCRIDKIDKGERPVIQQIFGSRPEIVAKAALLIKEKFSPDGIDINMGCPMKKIVALGAGAALMKNLPLAAEMVKQTKKALKNTPLSVKMRLGWNSAEGLLVFAQAMEKAGADLITIHGRTRTQLYGGQADLRPLVQVVKKLKIPVLANGDIFSAAKAKEALAITGAAGIMIGRGALGNPWIFKQIKEFLQHGRIKTMPTPEDKIKMLLKHAELYQKKYGDKSILRFRKFIGFYLKGFNHAKDLRSKLILTNSYDELYEELNEL